MAKKGLGKGLNSLFNEEDIEEVTSEITKSSEGDIKKVRMSLIEPNKKQPRRHFDEEKILAHPNLLENLLKETTEEEIYSDVIHVAELQAEGVEIYSDIVGQRVVCV